MNSREVLAELLEKNPDAKTRLEEIAQMQPKEAKKAFACFQEEHQISLKAADFKAKDMNQEQLAQITGGSACEIIDLGLNIYGLFDEDQTKRGTKRGSKRFK